ncbi:MAG TPA: hypothetical protein VNE67_17190 [Acetobacteraceae bacterium]|nr:hypothetical protein [Acetobacteraceae bacterium]
MIAVPADLPLTPQRLAHAAGELAMEQRSRLMHALLAHQLAGGESGPRAIGDLTRRFGWAELTETIAILSEQRLWLKAPGAA